MEMYRDLRGQLYFDIEALFGEAADKGNFPPGTPGRPSQYEGYKRAIDLIRGKLPHYLQTGQLILITPDDRDEAVMMATPQQVEWLFKDAYLAQRLDSYLVEGVISLLKRVMTRYVPLEELTPPILKTDSP